MVHELLFAMGFGDYYPAFGKVRFLATFLISDDPLRMARGTPAITLPLTRQQSTAKFVAFASSMASSRDATTSSAIVIRGRQRTSRQKR